jgi:outer membrane protein
MSVQDSKVGWAAGALALAALVLGVVGYVDQPRYGYTDVTELMAGYGPASAVAQKIEDELGPMRQKLKDQRQATAAVESKAIAQRAELSSADLAVLQLQLVTARQRQEELGRQLVSLEGRLRNERMKPVYDGLNRQMRRFGEEKGYAIIWTATASGNLAYASDAANITDDLLAWMSENPLPE